MIVAGGGEGEGGVLAGQGAGFGPGLDMGVCRLLLPGRGGGGVEGFGSKDGAGSGRASSRLWGGMGVLIYGLGFRRLGGGLVGAGESLFGARRVRHVFPVRLSRRLQAHLLHPSRDHCRRRSRRRA